MIFVSILCMKIFFEINFEKCCPLKLVPARDARLRDNIPAISLDIKAVQNKFKENNKADPI